MKPIVQKEEPSLRSGALPVEKEEFGTDALKSVVKDMIETLEGAPDGVALAAPQIGIGKRIFVVRYDRMLPPLHEEEQRPADVGVYINPKITKTSRRRVQMDEGCLSVRGIYGSTLRFERATVSAQDENGKTFTRGAGGILAQAFQHEIDHLDGILFIDHATGLYEAHHEHES